MRWLVVPFFAISFAGLAQAQENFGHFKGVVAVQVLPDGRNMQLLNALGYVDPNGKEWEVPAGTRTDGSSWPRVLISKQPPFAGKNRYAAILHDHFSEVKTRGWLDTHNMAYYAMRAAGVDEGQAKLAWALMYGTGTRWKQGRQTRGPLPQIPSNDYVRELDAWIKGNNPPLTEIANKIERPPGSNANRRLKLRMPGPQETAGESSAARSMIPVPSLRTIVPRFRFISALTGSVKI